jgi:hypothetical protein
MTMKFALFFSFLFPCSAKTSRFLLVALGASSIFNASTPLVILSDFFSAAVFPAGFAALVADAT